MNDITIEVEVCANCEKHSWFTSHKQQKYDECFQSLQIFLQRDFPNVKILKNPVPAHFKKITNKFVCEELYYDQLNDKVVSMPRLGAFEIFFQDKVIFSKIKSGQWPNIPTISSLIRKAIEDREAPNQSIENHQNHPTQPSSVIPPKGRPRSISPLNGRIRVKTETSFPGSATNSTQNSSTKAGESMTKFSDKIAMPPPKSKTGSFVRFKNSSQTFSTKESLQEGGKKITSIKHSSLSGKSSNSPDSSRTFNRTQIFVKQTRIIARPNLNRNISGPASLNKTTDQGYHTLNDSSIQDSSLVPDKDILETEGTLKIAERSKSCSTEVFELNTDLEKKVSIEVEVSLNRDADTIHNLQTSPDQNKEKPLPMPGRIYFNINDPDQPDLENNETPQMGCESHELMKTAHFGSNFERQSPVNLFSKGGTNTKSPDKAANRYAVPDFDNDLLFIKQNSVLTESTITFAGKNLLASIDSNRADGIENKRPDQRSLKEDRQASRGTLDFISDSFGHKEMNESISQLRGSLNRSSIDKEKLKLNGEIFEYKNPLKQQSIAKNNEIPASIGRKPSGSEFNFKNVEVTNPLLNDILELKNNFIKNSGTLQKRVNSRSTLENASAKPLGE